MCGNVYVTSELQAKSMLSSMQPGAFTSAFGRDCAFCSPVVLIVYNSPWPSSDAMHMLDLWQQKLQSCWEATPKSAIVQQAGMRSMFKASCSFALHLLNLLGKTVAIIPQS